MRKKITESSLDYDRIVLLDRHYASIEKLWVEVARQLDIRLEVLYLNSWRQAWMDRDFKKLLGYKRQKEEYIEEFHIAYPDGWTRYAENFFNNRVFNRFHIPDLRTIWAVNMPYFRYLSKKVDSENDLLIYQVVDDYPGYWPYKSEIINQQEQELVSNADLVFPVSVGLCKLFKKKFPNMVDKFFYLPNGTNANFDVHYEYDKNISSLDLGYLGSIAGRVDWNIITKLLQNYPDYRLHFYGNKPGGSDGKIMEDLLNRFDQFRFHGFVDQKKVPEVLSGFDIAIIPEKKTQFNYMGSPQKLWNYLAVGMPIVSMDVPEQKQFDDVIYIADTPQSFSDRIADAVDEIRTDNINLIENRKTIARNHFWPQLAKKLIHKLEEFA